MPTNKEVNTLIRNMVVHGNMTVQEASEFYGLPARTILKILNGTLVMNPDGTYRDEDLEEDE